MEDIFKSLMGDEKSDKRMSLSEILMVVGTYWNYLWEKKKIVIASGVICAALGLVYACVRTVLYTASYQFVIEGDNSARGFSLSSLLATGAGGAFTGNNLVELMRAPAMVERTLLKEVPGREDSINFLEYYLICDSIRAKCAEAAEVVREETEEDGAPVSVCDIQFPLHQDRETFSREQDSILMIVARKIRAKMVLDKPDKKISFVYCSYTYKDEEFCKKFIDAYMEEVISFYIETKVSRSSKNIANFQHQADSVKMEWDKAIASSAYYADGNINAARQAVGVELKRIQMKITTCSTMYAELMKAIATMKVDQMKETPVIQIIDQPHYPLENNKARKLKFIILGGFLGGFLSVFALVSCCFYKQRVKPVLETLPAKSEAGESV